MTTSLVPETAPFNEEQRAWLNGFLSGLMGMPDGPSSVPRATMDRLSQATLGSNPATTVEPEEDLDDAPWHDESLPIVERMALAEGKPKGQRLMAAMAQLDCGSCGYLCKTYSQAIASGEESNLTLCSPGGKETKQMIKKILQESDADNADPPKARNGKTNGDSLAKTNGASGGWSRKNPFSAKLLESRQLNKTGSAKDTRHVVIDLAGSGLKYHVGDALGIYPTNCTELASAIIARLGSEPQTHVSSPLGATKSLLSALCEDCCLKDASDELLELLADRVDETKQKAQLVELLEQGTPAGFDVLDALEIARGARITATEFMETLSPLNPRLYSIASSMRHVGDQVHLTVGKVHYERNKRFRKGVASTMLADRLQIGQELRVFVQPNHGGFTVPADSSKPMIMVGPGTGIAPFMAFLQERAATSAKGENWLLFGDQHAATDFLYEEQLGEYRSSGLLRRLDTAFSRDDANKKVYVQDRMRENAAELWQWLERGAYFYVCGDASRMAADVDRALKDIVAMEGRLDGQQAGAYVQQLAAQGRYARDVY